MIPTTLFLTSLVELFTEAFEGTPADVPSWFTTGGPEWGILGILRPLSFEQASYAFAQDGEPGATIAAHVEHLRWSLAFLSALIQGGKPEHDWEQSWSVQSVNPEEWVTLRAALEAEYRDLRHKLQAQTDLPEGYVKGAMSLVPHMGYHLGILRQMARTLETDGKV